MRIATGLLALLVLEASAMADESTVPGKLLADVQVKCQEMRIWGTKEDGEHWLMYDYSCRVPDGLRNLPKDVKAAELVDKACYKDQRYALMAAAAALGRIHELTPQQRMRLALEVALRENEPFASARIGFVFGDIPWWDQKYEVPDHGRNNGRLASLPGKWDKSQTEVIREYLFPKLPHRPVSMLAVYFTKLLAEADKLDPVIIPDLKKVIATTKTKSFEAELARSALGALGNK